MRKSLTFSYIFILFLSLTPGISQTFEFKGYSPFGIQIVNFEDSARFAYKHMFNDMDSDGDLDLFLYGLDEFDTTSTNSELQNLRYFIEIQENIGDKWNPEFKAREKKFENFDFANGNSFFMPSIGDLNADGRQDIVICAHADTNFIQNIRFDIQSSDFEFDSHLGVDYDLASFHPGSIFIPELIDLDMDGDLDLLLSGGSPSSSEEDEDINLFLYAKNIGTTTEPNFLGWFANPYGLETDSLPAFICGGDLNLDGDIDLLGVKQGDSLQVLEYFENNPGSDGKPLFSKANMSSFGLPEPKLSIEAFYSPSLVDIDGDGDVDIFLPYTYIDTVFGEGNAFTFDTLYHLFYYENVLCQDNQQNINETICLGDTIYIDGNGYYESGSWNIETINTEGCKSVVHLTLEVVPESTIYIEEQLCYGQSYFIGDLEFTESGHYELSLMSQSGCDSTIIADLEFTELNTDVEVSGPVLTAFYQDTYSYQWFDCDINEFIVGADNNTFEPIYSGYFGAIISNDFACVDTTECYYVDLTNTNSIQKSDGIIIAPNPTNGLISINNISGVKIKSIDIYGITGELIEKIDPDKMTDIDLSSNERGVYLFHINTIDNKSILKRVLLIGKI